MVGWRLLWAGFQTTWLAHSFIALIGSKHSRGGPSCEILIKYFTPLTPRATPVSIFMRLGIENGLSSFAVLTSKQNANSATKKIFLNSIFTFSRIENRMSSLQIVYA